MKVQIRSDKTGWTDVGEEAFVRCSGGERAISEQHTMDGDMPIVGAGKISAMILHVGAENYGASLKLDRVLQECDDKGYVNIKFESRWGRQHGVKCLLLSHPCARPITLHCSCVTMGQVTSILVPHKE